MAPSVERELPTEGPAALPYGLTGYCGTFITDLFPDDSGLDAEGVAKEARRIRGHTSFRDRSKAIVSEVNAGKWAGYEDLRREEWQVDHIVAASRMVKLPGFMELDPVTRARIANMNENTRPLHQPWNSSKQDLSYAQWPTRSPTGSRDAPTRAEWEQLCEEERRATIAGSSYFRVR
ncbi:hypothetical protein GCM10023217_10870 [Gordonia alkaliphila]|uniref:HNH endonuclease n=1 Tax=Gordonia alkaliphila TaxID=1053547 RepID=A0ABP8Z1M7_9ACTN